MTENKMPGILIPERFIPTPTTISPEAQAFLSAPMYAMAPAYPALDDAQGWRDHAALSNARLLAGMANRATTFPGTVTRHALPACALYEITPDSMRPEHADRAILDVHGGAFFIGAGEVCVAMARQIAWRTGVRTYALDYRMPPDHPFPAAVEDAVDALRFVMARHRPDLVAGHAGSAGANILPAGILVARDAGVPMPKALVLHSPGAEITNAGDTCRTNALLDVVLGEGVDTPLQLYANGHDPRDPRLSPLYGDFTKGFPATILTSGTRDLLLSNTVLLHRALRRAGVETELHVWEAMCHGLVADAPEAEELLSEQIGFLRRHLRLE